jgi:flagellum-specific peptidoglycan hydrolase FlgJ
VIESKWGEKPVGHAKYFGKCATRHTKWCTVATPEVENGKSVIENLEFADYDTLDDSCRDHGRLITNCAPYDAAWEQYQKGRDLPALVGALARVYATDPNYAHPAVAIADQTNVRQPIAASPSYGRIIEPLFECGRAEVCAAEGWLPAPNQCRFLLDPVGSLIRRWKPSTSPKPS